MSRAFEIVKKSAGNGARVGILRTAHGEIETPAYTIVGTHAEVRCLSSEDLLKTKTQLVIANTYHLSKNLGEKLDNFEGLHKKMNWQKPIMTDSGGFQVFSLGFAREHKVGKIASIFPQENYTQINTDTTQNENSPTKLRKRLLMLGGRMSERLTDWRLIYDFNVQRFNLRWRLNLTGHPTSQKVQSHGDKANKTNDKKQEVREKNLVKITEDGVYFYEDRPIAQRFFLLKSHNFGYGFVKIFRQILCICLKIFTSPRSKFWNFTDEKFLSSGSSEQKFLNAELSIQIQKKLGADIIFAFDECTSPLNDYEYTKKAMERTHRWAERSLAEHSGQRTARTFDMATLRHLTLRHLTADSGQRTNDTATLRHCDTATNDSGHLTDNSEQLLYGIVQGGEYRDLREASAKFIGNLPFDGFAIGGSLGRSRSGMFDVIKWSVPYLPEEKPRHLLGIGKIEDLFEAVELGIDTFDCVVPTREARHGSLWTKDGRFDIKKGIYADDMKKIQDDCECPVCGEENIKRKDLYELFKAKDKSNNAARFATIHNVYFFNDLMEQIREAIKENKFLELKKKFVRI